MATVFMGFAGLNIVNPFHPFKRQPEQAASLSLDFHGLQNRRQPIQDQPGKARQSGPLIARTPQQQPE